MGPVHRLLQPSLGGDEDDDDLSGKGILEKKKTSFGNLEGQ